MAKRSVVTCYQALGSHVLRDWWQMMTEYLLWVKQCHKPPIYWYVFKYTTGPPIFSGVFFCGIVLPTLISMFPLISINIQWWMGFFWDWLTTGLWHCVTHMIRFPWISGFLSATSLWTLHIKETHKESIDDPVPCGLSPLVMIISHLNSCML